MFYFRSCTYVYCASTQPQKKILLQKFGPWSAVALGNRPKEGENQVEEILRRRSQKERKAREVVPNMPPEKPRKVRIYSRIHKGWIDKVCGGEDTDIG